MRSFVHRLEHCAKPKGVGNFNASVSERMKRQVGPHGLGRQKVRNSFLLPVAYGMCTSNTFFPHKCIHQASWYPTGSTFQPSLEDYVLVKQRIMSSVLDTRVHKGGDMDSDHRLVVIPMQLNQGSNDLIWLDGVMKGMEDDMK